MFNGFTQSILYVLRFVHFQIKLVRFVQIKKTTDEYIKKINGIALIGFVYLLSVRRTLHLATSCRYIEN